jgi:cholesterol transport system auxiliary component
MSKQSFSIGRRAALVGGSSAVVLGACSGIIGPPASSPIYVLQPQYGPAAAGPPVRWQLTVDLPQAADALDTMRILLLQPTGQMDYYADANWQDRLPYVLQGTLVEAFETSGRMRAVGRDTEGLKSDYLLITDVRDFQARYSAPDAPPTAVVRIVAKLVATRTRTIIITKDAHAEAQAARNDLPSVIAAFNQALSGVQTEIVEAALNAPAPA